MNTVRTLVPTLDDSVCVGPVTKVLSRFGPSEETVPPLVGALGNPLQRPAAKSLLIGYGKRALVFIRRPRAGSPLYRQLTEVINSIKAQAS